MGFVDWFVDWFVDPYGSAFMQRAAVAALMVGVLAPAVGVWVVLRRQAYLGDAMSRHVGGRGSQYWGSRSPSGRSPPGSSWG